MSKRVFKSWTKFKEMDIQQRSPHPSPEVLFDYGIKSGHAHFHMKLFAKCIFAILNITTTATTNPVTLIQVYYTPEGSPTFQRPSGWRLSPQTGWPLKTVTPLLVRWL